MKRPILVLCVCLCVGIFAVSAFSNARTDDALGIAVSPQTFLLSAVQGSVSVHTAIGYSTVDLGSLALNGVAPTSTKADSRGNLVAKFDEAEIEALLAPPTADLTLTGLLKDGTAFSGTDRVRVVP